jgi:hypothetical protein
MEQCAPWALSPRLGDILAYEGGILHDPGRYGFSEHAASCSPALGVHAQSFGAMNADTQAPCWGAPTTNFWGGLTPDSYHGGHTLPGLLSGVLPQHSRPFVPPNRVCPPTVQLQVSPLQPCFSLSAAIDAGSNQARSMGPAIPSYARSGRGGHGKRPLGWSDNTGFASRAGASTSWDVAVA